MTTCNTTTSSKVRATTLLAATVNWPKETLGQDLVMEFIWDLDYTGGGYQITIRAEHEYIDEESGGVILMSTEALAGKDGDVVITPEPSSLGVTNVKGTVLQADLNDKAPGGYYYTLTVVDPAGGTERPIKGTMYFEEVGK